MNLEQSSGDSIDWREILNRVESLATSETGRTVLRQLSPLPTALKAMNSFERIEEAREVLLFGERPFAESIDLFSSWHSRLRRDAVLQTLELRDVRRFCIEVLALNEVLVSTQIDLNAVTNRPWVTSLLNRLMDSSPPLSSIDQLMTPSGEIRNDASEPLGSLFKERATQTRALHSALDRLVKGYDMEPVVQERFVTTREGRWVIPVKSGMQHAFPGIIHGSSQSKQTVFMEPETVVPLNNRLREIEVEIEAEIERLLIALSKYLKTLVPDFQSSYEALLEADVTFAKAKFADILEAHPVHFIDNGLDLRDVRHPLLVLKGTKVIPNSVKLGSINGTDDKRILLLSGPNAGGKTVLLKSIGLAAQMARCGLPVCADEGSRLPFFKGIHIAVGDEQSVDAELSTFAAHIQILNSALSHQGSEHLLLIDEICGSTDPEEGSALARSFIERYAENRVLGVITSHLGPLKTGWQRHSGIINGSLEYNQKSGLPTYQFLSGVPGQSLALQTARRVGVDSKLLERALEYLSPEAKARHEHLRDLEAVKDEISQMRKQVFAELDEARTSKRKYLELIANFRKEREQWMDRTIKKTERKIDEMLDFSTVDSVFKKHERLSEVRSKLPEIVRAPPAGTTNRRRIESVEDFERIYPAGSKIFVPTIGAEGLIQGRANNKGEIPVVANSMRLFLHWTQLKPPQTLTNPTQSIFRRASGSQVTVQDTERTIDIRGKTIDDAIAHVETQLDAAILNSEDRVRIVHGHGTETLKRAVRTHLSRSPYVKKWKAANTESGGDGVTWADLKD